MAYFAEIDNNRIVKRVIVADQTFINSGAVGDPKNWIETDYHGKKRKNYAGIGFQYDKARDAFIGPKPFSSWTLDETTCKWKAPKPYPNKGLWKWDEQTQDWIKE